MQTTSDNVIPFRSREAFMRTQADHLTAILDEVRGHLMRRPPVPADATEIVYTDDGLPYLSVSVTETDTILISPASANVRAAPLTKPGRFDVIYMGECGGRMLAEGIAPDEAVSLLRSII